MKHTVQCLLPSLRIHYDCVRLVNHARNQRLSVLACKLSNLDHITSWISPVEVTSHPVHRDSTWHFQTWNLKRRQDIFREDIAKHQVQHLTLKVLTHIQVGDAALALPRVSVRVGSRTWWWGWSRQLEAGNARGVPVCPVNAIGLDVQVHGIDAHVDVALECLFVNHPRI